MARSSSVCHLGAVLGGVVFAVLFGGLGFVLCGGAPDRCWPSLLGQVPFRLVIVPFSTCYLPFILAHVALFHKQIAGATMGVHGMLSTGSEGEEFERKHKL